ncbi:hypothetical protein KZ813_10125 [Sphingomonas sp. RHCKR7]|uniref:hypothetical protein n=1 Tax=Sphingomonas folli TaxID=2862497 RepID=UPI001CA490C0|nr:hypothetical protein [Sphingomonas folli]MBW6527196.1 hypothetical protein [Sphingomonas folli]
MFHAGSGGTGVGTYDHGDDRSPEKRQYTVKGIEAETVTLMRSAANKEGMKIGSWVSLRMREAAERALANGDDCSLTKQADLKLDNAVSRMAAVLERYERNVEARLVVVERELHEITSSQRSILSALIQQRSE